MDAVPYINDEVRPIAIDLFPHLYVDRLIRVARPVAQDRKPEIIDGAAAGGLSKASRTDCERARQHRNRGNATALGTIQSAILAAPAPKVQSASFL